MTDTAPDDPADQVDATAPAPEPEPFEPFITEPGVYDLPAEVYHADPVVGGSLSSTGARLLLPPSCPALFKHRQDHPEPHKRAFDFGSAAHALILGIGRPLEVIDADNYRTKKAQLAKADAYAAEKIPVLAREYAEIQLMADKIREHPTAGALLDPLGGNGERTLVWQDRTTGVMCRAMLDWLPQHQRGARLIVPDYKTAIKVDPESLSKELARHQLYQQAEWYRAGVRALGLGGDIDPAFVFIFQQKEAPYLVTVAQLPHDEQMWGDRMNRSALDLYRRCVEDGRWPGYADDVISLELPNYAKRALEDAWALNDFNPTTREAMAA
jgi:hypothetical protein